jgi:hypothetical protein
MDGVPVRSCEHRDSRLPVRTPDIANDLPRLDHTRGKAQTEVNCWALRISQSWGDLLHMIHRWALRQPLLRRPVFSHPTDSTPSRCVQCRRWDERHALMGVQFVPKWISNLLGSCRYAVQRWSPSARLPASCAACVVRIKLGWPVSSGWARILHMKLKKRQHVRLQCKGVYYHRCVKTKH